MSLSAITSFGRDFIQLSMNSSIEVSKFKPEQIFEKTINDIKDIHLKNIASYAMNLSVSLHLTGILNRLV